LLTAFGAGVAAPSANRYGKVSPTTAPHVIADLDGDVDLVLDGGPCAVGVESTIVDVTGDRPVILRVGGVSEARIAELTGAMLERRISGEIAASGTKASHYAPRARVELVGAADVDARVAALRAEGVAAGALLTGALVAGPAAGLDADEYARALYAALREADDRGWDVVVAVLPADEGLGAAIADRLRRAAAR
jgi:L-threonylcarbamoyladenylate synthase